MILIKEVHNKKGDLVSLDDLSKEFLIKIKAFHKSSTIKKGILFSFRRDWKTSKSLMMAFLSEIKINYEKIISGNPKELQKIVNDFEAKGYNALLYRKNPITRKDGQTVFGAFIEAIFDYSTFRSSNIAVWMAEELNLKACPYCNSQYILSYDKSVSPTFSQKFFSSIKDNRKNERALFEFDHFFPKSRYPYLCTSFYNLVPSCKPCNATKSASNINIDDFVHPYDRSFHAFFEIDLSDKEVIDFILKRKNIKDIEVSINPKKSAPTNADIILKNHLKSFYLDKVYQLHKDVIEELYLKSYYYNKSRKQELLDMKITGTGEKLFNESTLGRFILGNYSLESEINNRPLSKMTIDVAEKIDLLKFNP